MSDQRATAAVLAVFGPTGIGKTEVAVAVADRMRARGEQPVAVSADALQVYRGLEVLTGAPTAQERETLEHRLVSIAPVTESFSAGRYAELAHAEVDALLREGHTPIVVGGTGLYLRAALADLHMPPPPPEAVRERWQRELQTRGPQALHAELARRNPAAAERISPTDRTRVVRYLELDEMGLDPPGADPNSSRLWTRETRHPTRLVGLVCDREELYARIDRRVQAMVQAGATEEVKAAHRAGASATARQALGFEELLAGDEDAMARRTRQFAKRQLTWMRKLPDVELIDVTGRTAADVALEIIPDAEPPARLKAKARAGAPHPGRPRPAP